MRFTHSIEIDAPREFVTSFFGDVDNKKLFHSGLKSHESIMGNPGETGSITRLDFDKFILTETVLANELPDEYYADYDAGKNCRNTLRSTFKETGEKTIYEAETDYSYLGFMMKIISWVMPWTIKRAVGSYMEKFKQTVEEAYRQSSQ